MYITADDIKNEISFYYLIDNRNENKKVGLIRAYFVYSFYNVEKDEKIHLKNGEMLKVKRGCYTMKNIEKVSSGKVKYDSLTGNRCYYQSIRTLHEQNTRNKQWKLHRHAIIEKNVFI